MVWDFDRSTAYVSHQPTRRVELKQMVEESFGEEYNDG